MKLAAAGRTDIWSDAYTAILNLVQAQKTMFFPDEFALCCEEQAQESNERHKRVPSAIYNTTLESP